MSGNEARPASGTGHEAVAFEFHDLSGSSDITGTLNTRTGRAGADDNDSLNGDGSFGFSDNVTLLREENAAQRNYGAPIWSLDYYAQFFNIETHVVRRRLVTALWPFGARMLDTLNSNPDLYGPIWISTTLVFAMAMAGNFSSYLASETAWQYDFEMVTFGATSVYGYVLVVPLLLWAALRWLIGNGRIAFTELVCLYGYSLSIFIPVALLSIFQVEWFRWLAVIIALFFSGGALLTNIWPLLRTHPHRISYGICAAMLLSHATLAIVFKLFFFEYNAAVGSSGNTPAPAPSHTPVPSPSP